MGKDIKGKELGVGISQGSDGFYVGRFTTKYGQQKQKNLGVKVIPMEWSEYVFLCRKGMPVKTARMTPCYLNSVTRILTNSRKKIQRRLR